MKEYEYRLKSMSEIVRQKTVQNSRLKNTVVKLVQKQADRRELGRIKSQPVVVSKVAHVSSEGKGVMLNRNVSKTRSKLPTARPGRVMQHVVDGGLVLGGALYEKLFLKEQREVDGGESVFRCVENRLGGKNVKVCESARYRVEKGRLVLNS